MQTANINLPIKVTGRHVSITDAIKDYAVKNGYTMFIRKGDLIYTDGKNDIKDLTDDILKLYDDSQQEEGTKKQP